MPDNIPDDAFVVRGGQNLPENFANGSGVTIGSDGRLDGVSVNMGAEKSIEELTAPNPANGYPGIPNNQVGVTTVGAIRSAGGDVRPAPRKRNPYHATLSGLMPKQASDLFRPTIPNPNRSREKQMECSMSLPKVYADFQNLDDENRLRLTCAGTVRDLTRHHITLHEGLVLTFYMDDADDRGNLDELRAQGTVKFNQAENCWVAAIDWSALRHASDEETSHLAAATQKQE